MTPPPSASKDFVGTWITFMSGSLVLGKRMKTVRIGFSVLVLFGVMFFGITHAEAARFSCCVCRRTGSSVTVCSQSRERDPDNTAAAATAAERCSQVDSAASAFTCFITENTCTATTLCAGLTAAPLGEPAIQFTNCCLLTKAGSPSVCLQSSPYAAGDTDRTRAGDQRCGDLNNSGAEYEGYRNRFYTNERCSHISECGSGTVRSLGEGEPTVAQVGTLAPRVGATSCVTAGDCLGGQTCVERTCRNASGGGCATDADCGTGSTCNTGADNRKTCGAPIAPTEATVEVPFVPITPILGVAIPGADLSAPTMEGGVVRIAFLSQYINAAYRYLTGVILVIAIVMCVYGGFLYLVGSAGVGTIQRGKKIITDAIMGMIITLAAYSLLNTVNPNTINLKVLEIASVQVEERENGGFGDSTLSSEESNRVYSSSLRGGGGDAQDYRRQTCDGYADNGQEFEAFFTNYYAPTYGSAAGPMPWRLTTPGNPSSRTTQLSGNEPATSVPWSFFCNTAMECSCPQGKDNTLRCFAGSGPFAFGGERNGWAPCKPFGRNIPFCGQSAADGTPARGGRRLEVGGTVAADRDCFYVRSGCKLEIVGTGRTVEITDSGSGIRGRRFDMFTNEARQSSVTGVHRVRIVNPETCRQSGPYRGGVP